MTSLHIAVNRKFATCTDQISIICGNSDYIAVFSFDKERSTNNARSNKKNLS